MSDWPMFQRADLNAVMVEFAPYLDIKINQSVQRLAAYLTSERPKWLLESVPSYRNLLVYYDFQIIEFAEVCEALTQAYEASLRADLTVSTITHEIPVCYEPEFGDDLTPLAEELGLSIEDLVTLHSERDYHVYAIGFAPNFAYLGDVVKRLQVARLTTPRKRVPPLSVAIAEQQTAVYPQASPGGWRLLGQAAYLPTFSAGDQVRFKPISGAEFKDLRADKRGKS